jgi:hypothetical protein
MQSTPETPPKRKSRKAKKATNLAFTTTIRIKAKEKATTGNAEAKLLTSILSETAEPCRSAVFFYLRARGHPERSRSGARRSGEAAEVEDSIRNVLLSWPREAKVSAVPVWQSQKGSEQFLEVENSQTYLIEALGEL